MGQLSDLAEGKSVLPVGPPSWKEQPPEGK